jgi:hypothetical protein
MDNKPSIFLVIGDNGDGSQRIEFYKGENLDSEKIREKLEDNDDYQSGDGVQITKLTFPIGFDVNQIEGIEFSELD